MTLFKPTYTRDGERHKVRVWWVQATIAKRKKRQSTGCRDKRAAEEKARSIVRTWEREAAGLSNPFEAQQARPLREHVADFRAVLRAKGRTPAYIERRLACINAFLDAAKPRDVGALDAGAAAVWLDTFKDRNLAAATINHRIRSLYQFGRWLQRTRRLPHNPFASLSVQNEAADRRRVRRALAPEQLTALIEAAAMRTLRDAQERRVKGCVSALEERRLRRLGHTRALVYALAAGTGLRRQELRRLRWCDCDLKQLSIRVPAASAKSRKEQTVPLRAQLADALRAFRPAGVTATDTVIPSGMFPNMNTLRADLKSAGIPYRDEEGRVADFHSLRVSFISGLAAAGVHPREAQALARHSDIKLTMQTYTDVRLLDLHRAVESGAGDLGRVLAPMLAPQPVRTTENASQRRMTQGDMRKRRKHPEATDGSGSAANRRRARNGAPGRIRTVDPGFTKAVLYH